MTEAIMGLASETYNEDCMIGMKRYPDKFFELAIVDPEYGIDAANMNMGKGGGVAKSTNYKKKNWDKYPATAEYFAELIRVSNNQIVFGGNYFSLPISKGWVVWQKFLDISIVNDYSPFELAWTSFNKCAIFQYLWSGFWQGDMKNKEQRIHPTQKPVALYKWLLKNYAKEGDKIIDTHMGSQSSRIAAYDMGFDYYGWEIDKDYFEAGEKRFQLFKSQQKLQFA